jgi:hypothetical protein
MNEKYTVWDTPLKFGKSLCLVSLHQENDLTVIIQDNRDNFRRVKFHFQYVPAFRSIDETYRTSEPVNNTKSWTVIVENSEWISELCAKELIFKHTLENIKHYQIITEYEVFDILSVENPTVEEIDPGNKCVGQAEVLYHPEDREKIDQFLNKINKN